MTVELTKAEVQTLKGVLLVEQNDLNELVANEENARDKKSLQSELEHVNSILEKIK